ncbi:Pepsin A [Durusdinium trenchii]|uniref:peptidylprolyl isomerase n=1 Tax=Durusdinium trenchii TaxID=1381693 RepID=A0ABP0LYQ9_9DINO
MGTPVIDMKISNETEQPFGLVPFDGIFGLGLPQMSQAPHFNVLDCMIRDKVLKKNLFSVFLAADDKEESEISFGEYKPSRMAGELFWVPVSHPGYWQVEMQDVTINDQPQELCNGDGDIFDVFEDGLWSSGDQMMEHAYGRLATWSVDWDHTKTAAPPPMQPQPQFRRAPQLVAVLLGARQVRRTRRGLGAAAAVPSTGQTLEKQWEEFYERDERDAREGWAIDVFEDDRLLKVILEASPRPQRVIRPHLGDEVTIRCSWGVEDGPRIETAKEVTFRMGQTDGIIKGLEEAVMTMSQGETSRFFLAPDLAYGDQGTDQVPPGATLEYEISLLNVVDMDPDIDEFDEDFEIPEDLDKMGKNDLGEGGRDPRGRYLWERHGQDMLVWLPISDTTSSSDVDCLLLKNHISATVEDEVIFDGEPGLEIDEDESYWEIENDSAGQRCVCIHLRKDHEFKRWPPKLLTSGEETEILYQIQKVLVLDYRMRDLGFRMGGHTLTLSPEDYVDRDGHSCSVALMTMDVPPPKGPLFIFGDPFLRKYYTVYDRENLQVGFALAAQSNITASPQRIT